MNSKNIENMQLKLLHKIEHLIASNMDCHIDFLKDRSEALLNLCRSFEIIDMMYDSHNLNLKKIH